MIVMVALDDHQGLCFNHRRQSRDRVLRDYMLDLAGDSGIWLNAYSASMFTEDTHTLHIAEDFLDQAGPGEYALVEDKAVRPYAGKIEKLIVFRWNRSYPADMYFDLTPDDGWQLQSSRDFAGSSHDKITEEVYSR
ncbi:ribonuclease Z [Megasphaera hominis]|jgi:hypothetical protein|uniref:Ribonuclease Z n=1 Tax=Megasphaera hominis TaxID=159836 RepID=A0ABR6VFS1_9FIRM|nr:ribonuclease Z [Megasphaera hominis]MBC3536140.1 ribonuclease Z [Megasphaera hominis]